MPTVTGYIEPIQAERLQNVSACLGAVASDPPKGVVSAAGFCVAGVPKQDTCTVEVALEHEAAVRFTADGSPDEVSLIRAAQAAENVIAILDQLPHNEGSAGLIAMAFAVRHYHRKGQ